MATHLSELPGAPPNWRWHSPRHCPAFRRKLLLTACVNCYLSLRASETSEKVNSCTQCNWLNMSEIGLADVDGYAPLVSESLHLVLLGATLQDSVAACIAFSCSCDRHFISSPCSLPAHPVGSSCKPLPLLWLRSRICHPTGP